MSSQHWHTAAHWTRRLFALLLVLTMIRMAAGREPTASSPAWTAEQRQTISALVAGFGRAPSRNETETLAADAPEADTPRSEQMKQAAIEIPSREQVASPSVEPLETVVISDAPVGTAPRAAAPRAAMERAAASPVDEVKKPEVLAGDATRLRRVSYEAPLIAPAVESSPPTADSMPMVVPNTPAASSSGPRNPLR